MYKTSFRVSLFLIILLLPYTVLFAAGLGKLSLMSALGQPLSAEIDIVTANKDEIPSLRASIASQEAFAQAGIQYEPFFSAVKVSVESRINGNPYIKLSSPQAINDPFRCGGFIAPLTQSAPAARSAAATFAARSGWRDARRAGT